MELRSTAKDKARRKGAWRMAILAAGTLVIAGAVLTFLLMLGTPTAPADPNAKTSAPAPASR